MYRNLRNIAIIAHVDHGKTTLVDKLLQQTGSLSSMQLRSERVLDSNDLEKERGITILAKNASLTYQGTRINIVDTPGHADFGGEVERVLGMVDGVLLLVDAVEGPMPQTTFVTRKALLLGLKPILVVNKIDRVGARADWVVNQVFDLFDKLGATEEQLDFSVIYASAINGFATLDQHVSTTNMNELFELILSQVPAPLASSDGSLQLQIAALDYSSFIGQIGIGRIRQGAIFAGQQVLVAAGSDGARKTAKINQIQLFHGTERIAVDTASAGDIVLISGIDALTIGLTICNTDNPEPLPMLKIDEPTISMNFQVNTSPLAGTEGKSITSRQIRERLQRELLTNVALRVEETTNADEFLVAGRGELHLTILLENMRREGFEIAVSKPQVIIKIINNEKCEPYELLTVNIESIYQGIVMDELGRRKAELLDMSNDSNGQVRLEYKIPARGLIGFQGVFMSITRGTGLAAHIFADYGPLKADLPGRHNGVLVSQNDGIAVAYALWHLEDRGKMFIEPGEKVYEGMIIGIHARDNDLNVNPIKEKQLTNVRASGTDEAVRLTTVTKLTLESAIEFIDDDELVEITPSNIRLRKRHLNQNERKKASR